jgi:hypothetical protein
MPPPLEPIPTFVIGAVARPIWSYPDRSGIMRDFYRRLSAQGRVVGVIASESFIGVPYWDRTRSGVATPTHVGRGYIVKAWDIESGTYFEARYPARELQVGSVNGVRLTAPIPDPESDRHAANLVRTRT